MSGLLFYMHDGPATFRFELSGSLSGGDVEKLEQAWKTASSTFDGKVLAVDLSFLTDLDNKGRRLLSRWSQSGAHFVGRSEQSQRIIESITGRPYVAYDPAVGPTFDPLFSRSAFTAVAAALVFAVTLLFPSTAWAANGHVELKPETLDAWKQYISSAQAGMQERAQESFLWTDGEADRLRRVQAGETIAGPLIHAPKSVSGGLIHHWIGAAFIPGARIEDVITVVRNYDRYTEIYKPSVIDAKIISKQPAEDRFTVVVADNAMFMKRSLESEYDSRFIKVDGRKWYSVAETTRVQELSDERLIPEGEGSGYIWRLCTISRFEERDHGVYFETEIIALSRPIPMALHWVVDPIVRRVSRTTLAKTVEQTRDATESAVRSGAALSASRMRAVR